MIKKAKNLFVLWIMFLLPVASAVAAGADLRLVDAVKQKNKEAVRSLLKEHVDVNARQADGATALHWAAHWDDLEAADLLIRGGADVNAANDYGVTPLSLACTNADAPMVDSLLKAGANANAVQPTGETVLMTCARAGSVSAVRSLLARGARVDSKDTEYGQTALMWAAAQGHSAVAQALIEKGADIHEYSKNGLTPLLFAARSGDVQTAEVLIETGANVNEVSKPPQRKPEAAGIAKVGNYNDEGSGETSQLRPMTPLLMASASGNEKLAVFLLDRGADPNVWDGGAAPIHYAMLQGIAFIGGVPRANYVAFLFRPNMRELVKALLAHGANPNVQFESSALSGGTSGFRVAVGASPFLLATSSNDTELMRLLAANGADTRLTTKSGLTPLMVAAGSGRGNSRPEDALDNFRKALEATKLALELGNDIKAVDNRGWTALHGAAFTGSDPIVEFLVEKGADVNAKAKNGDTPLDLAIPQNKEIVHTSTGEILMKNGAKSKDGAKK
jgi:ankyrin repeat protein